MKAESVVRAIAHRVRTSCTYIHAFAAAVLAVDGKQMVQRERGREGEMWPEYGLINYGVQTVAAAALERAREDASFADDGKEYEFLARHTDDDAGVMSR